jgi:putative ubiquitin-RnfH superfamily antitoxin RatB of RatAB toxin-antitoxin module
VEGTVASVAVGRNGGEHVRLTNGMDLLVPSSITRMRQGRRYTATLRPGDVIRANVYSREGDGRDAQVRSFEILQTVGYNDGRFSGTVISVNRRSNIMAMRTENGRTVNVDLGIFSRGNASARAFRAGDRILVTGRMDRGTVIADDVRIVNNRR